MICYKILAFFQEIIRGEKTRKTRLRKEPILFCDFLVGYFDGSTQEGHCGGGMIININDGDHFSFCLRYG